MGSVLELSLKDAVMSAVNQKLILQGISWDFYEQLLEEYKDSNAVRLAFDNGFLEVEVPLLKHETLIRLLSDLVSTICVELDLDVWNVGSTTFRKRSKLKGCEPDTAFYIQNVKKVRGLNEIDLSKDPPPDLVIEVDITSPSLNKMPIYAALGVPEIWRYKSQKIECYRLHQGIYEKIENSDAFPMLSSEKITEFLQSGSSETYTKWIREVRKWINNND